MTEADDGAPVRAANSGREAGREGDEGEMARGGRPVLLDGSVGARRRENFPIASRLLPPAVRRDLLAVYDYCRLVDDLGDEAQGDRLAQLDWVAAEVDRAFDGRPSHPVLVRLVPAIRAHDLDPEPFHRLIEANRRDQRVQRYETWAELREYCSFSADPVGRLVLAIFDAATPERVARSDEVCTGLQLVEHIQDLAEDRRAKGRVYLPAEDLARFGATESDLDAADTGPELRAVIRLEVARARGLLAAGVALAASLRGPTSLAIAGFTAGGLATLDAIEATGHDVLAGPARARRRAFANRYLRTVRDVRSWREERGTWVAR